MLCKHPAKIQGVIPRLFQQYFVQRCSLTKPFRSRYRVNETCESNNFFVLSQSTCKVAWFTFECSKLFPPAWILAFSLLVIECRKVSFKHTRALSNCVARSNYPNSQVRKLKFKVDSSLKENSLATKLKWFVASSCIHQKLRQNFF